MSADTICKTVCQYNQSPLTSEEVQKLQNYLRRQLYICLYPERGDIEIREHEDYNRSYD